MAFPLSPKVTIKEIDLTNIIPAVATTDIAMVGLFRWGPLNHRLLLSSERKLVETFQTPDDDTYEHFLGVSNVLSYTNKVRVVRVAKESQTDVELSDALSTDASSNVVEVSHTSHGLQTGAVITISGFSGTLDTNITATEINGRHTITRIDANSYSFEVTNEGAAGVTTDGGDITIGIGDFALNSTTEKSTGSGTPGEGLLIKNEDHYDISFADGSGNVGLWAAKYPGKVGNSLKVSLCPSADAFSKTLTGTLSTKIKATGTLTGDGTNITDGDTVTIDGKVYTFQDTLTNVDGNVKKGASAAASLTNLFHAINASGGVSGTDYAAATTAHSTVVATNPTATTVKVTAITPGTGGNSLATTEASTHLAWGGATLSGGLDNSTTVTGTGTVFTDELVEGSILVHPTSGTEIKVESIESDTSLTLESAFGTNLSGSTVVGKWEYYEEFGVAPGTSPFARTRGCSNDEVHIVVIDEDGLFSQERGQVLEKFAFASLMGNAKTDEGEGNYYKTVINRKSDYIWWMDHLPAGTNWGSTSDGTTFTDVIIPATFSLSGGLDGNSEAATADFERGLDLFSEADQVDVSVIVCPPGDMVAAEYVIQNICEVRKDCIAVLSPQKSSVVNNNGDEVDDIKADLAGVTASSYAVVDCNWGYQYDRYNDVYRFVPCCSHVAGLMARVDNERDPWWSPAGLIYGHLKNIVKLGWIPTEAQRDDLYQVGINPIIQMPGQGTVLWGDKTYLNRPSAFDRINVRRLFIVLEKAIATAAKVIIFSFNDEITRAQFRNLVEPFLREVKGRRGVYDYKVVCDESNNPQEVIDRNTLIGDIYIKPSRVINFITLNFVAVRTGVAFSEVVGQF